MKKIVTTLMIFAMLVSSTSALAKPDNKESQVKGYDKKANRVEQVQTVEDDEIQEEAIIDENVDGEVEETDGQVITKEEAKKQIEELKQQFEEQRKNKEERKKVLAEIAQVKKELKDNKVGVFVNGKELKSDVPPVIKDGRTLIPVRAVMNAMGADVQWDPVTRTVTITKQAEQTVADDVYNTGGETVIKLQLDSRIAYINDEETTLDVPAGLENGRTIVPLRFISEALGCEVEWDGESGTVIIEEEEEQVDATEEDVVEEDSTDSEADIEVDDESTTQ